MNICIVTVYNSANSGSFWQAYALKEYLENLGHTVFFLKRNIARSSASKRQRIKNILRVLVRFQLKTAMMTLKGYAKFDKAQSSFEVIEMKDMKEKLVDLVILGSDTIWNIENPYFKQNIDVYWGGCFENVAIVSYAASVANTSIDTIKKNRVLINYAERWNKIGVRDQHTRAVINELGSFTIDIVCDPTFLLDKRDYELMLNKNLEQDYIFLYLFKNISKEQEKDIIGFAKEKKLRIISGVKHWKYCDNSIVNCPDNFLQYMLGAKYVITDTFHGAVFSVNLEKQFVSITRNKKKVEDFLTRVGFGDRMISDNTISQSFTHEINYEERHAKIEEFKLLSKKYIDDIIVSMQKD